MPTVRTVRFAIGMHACSSSSASPSKIVSQFVVPPGDEGDKQAPQPFQGEYHQSSLTRHRTELILPVRQKKPLAQPSASQEPAAKNGKPPLPLPPNALFEFKSASAPNSPLTRVRHFAPEVAGGNQKTSVSYQVDDYQKQNRSASPVFYARTRHRSLCSALQPQLTFSFQQSHHSSIPPISEDSSPSSSFRVSISPATGSAAITQVVQTPGCSPFQATHTTVLSSRQPITKAHENLHHQSLINNMSYFNRQMSTPIGPLPERQTLPIPPRPNTASPTTPNRSLLPVHREVQPLGNNSVTPPPRPLTSVSDMIHRRNSLMAGGTQSHNQMDNNYFSGKRLSLNTSTSAMRLRFLVARCRLRVRENRSRQATQNRVTRA